MGPCVKAVLAEGGHRWGSVPEGREGQWRETQDAEQWSPAKILQYSLSSKAGLQPSKYSG